MTQNETIAYGYALSLLGAQLDDLDKIKAVMADVAHLLEQHADENLARDYYEKLTGTSTSEDK